MFGDMLRALRRERDLTQAALADLAGCAAQTVRAFESGRRRPSRAMAERLAQVLGVPPEQRDAFLRLARDGVNNESVVQVVLTTAVDVSPGRSTTMDDPVALVSGVRPAELPVPANVLIGRAEELSTISARLREPACRLLTIIGPGGVGKTRLALQVARDLAAERAFADGVVWVDLAPITAVETVAPALATALGLQLTGRHAPEQEIIAHLRARACLLVLDNFEHLLLAGQLIEQILQHAPGVVVLATSRERLQLASEWVIDLEGLPVPQADATADDPAVILFLERARQIDQRFALTPQVAPAIAQICRLLEGIPLGIELAATWVRVLQPAEIAAEIARSLDFLAANNPVIPPRHRSLRAVFDHSWQRLTPAEQRLLARLSVFRGSATREAITHVAGDPASPPAALLMSLATLVDKSLLRRFTDAAGTTRYNLHEVIRQYAALHLAEDPAEHAATRARHAAYYAGWLAVQEPLLKSAAQHESLLALGYEVENARVAWFWAAEAQDATLLMQMVHTLSWYYELRGWNLECANLFAHGSAALRERVEHGSARVDEQVAYWLLTSIEAWKRVFFEPARSVTMFKTALEPIRRLGNGKVRFHGMIGLVYLTVFAGDREGSRALLDEALAAAKEANYAWGEVIALSLLSILELLYGDLATAWDRLHESLAAARAVGDARLIALNLNYCGMAALALGRLDPAEQSCRECLALQATQGRYQLGLSLQILGQIARARGDLPEAERLLRAALELARTNGDRWQEAETLSNLGLLLAERGDTARARHLLHDAVQVARAVPAPLALDVLLAYTTFELRHEISDAALVALAYLASHPRIRPLTRARAEQQQARLTEQVAPERRAAAEAHARSLALEHPADLLALWDTLRTRIDAV